jgi:L-rhamnonate dehydratase
VIITDVEAIVLDTGKDYPDPAAAGEAHGVRFVSLLKISTDAGITGWSDIETQPHVGKAIVDAPSGGAVGFEGLRGALVGEDPLERERLWQKIYRYLAYYGRQGAGMQMISGADIALWDIAGKAFGQPVHKLLGARYRDTVAAYASTLFRPTPEGMQERWPATWSEDFGPSSLAGAFSAMTSSATSPWCARRERKPDQASR